MQNLSRLNISRIIVRTNIQLTSFGSMIETAMTEKRYLLFCAVCTIDIQRCKALLSQNILTRAYVLEHRFRYTCIKARWEPSRLACNRLSLLTNSAAIWTCRSLATARLQNSIQIPHARACIILCWRKTIERRQASRRCACISACNWCCCISFATRRQRPKARDRATHSTRQKLDVITRIAARILRFSSACWSCR